MKENTERVREFVKETYEHAQAKIINLEEEVQKLAEKAKEEGKKRFEEIIGQFNWKELLEKLQSNEMWKQTQSVRTEFFELLGLATSEGIKTLEERVISKFDELGKQLDKLKSKRTSKAKNDE